MRAPWQVITIWVCCCGENAGLRSAELTADKSRGEHPHVCECLTSREAPAGLALMALSLTRHTHTRQEYIVAIQDE